MIAVTNGFIIYLPIVFMASITLTFVSGLTAFIFASIAAAALLCPPPVDAVKMIIFISVLRNSK